MQIGELSASMTPLNINQMTRWVNTKEDGRQLRIPGDRDPLFVVCRCAQDAGLAGVPGKPKEHAGKIITLMSEYCLCQRIKPVSDPKTPFSSEARRTECGEISSPPRLL